MDGGVAGATHRIIADGSGDRALKILVGIGAVLGVVLILAFWGCVLAGIGWVVMAIGNWLGWKRLRAIVLGTMFFGGLVVAALGYVFAVDAVLGGGLIAAGMVVMGMLIYYGMGVGT